MLHLKQLIGLYVLFSSVFSATLVMPCFQQPQRKHICLLYEKQEKVK